MKIRIHYRDQHSGPWVTTIAEVDQIPQMSDFVAPAPIKVWVFRHYSGQMRGTAKARGFGSFR